MPPRTEPGSHRPLEWEAPAARKVSRRCIRRRARLVEQRVALQELLSHLGAQVAAARVGCDSRAGRWDTSPGAFWRGGRRRSGICTAHSPQATGFVLLVVRVVADRVHVAIQREHERHIGLGARLGEQFAAFQQLMRQLAHIAIDPVLIHGLLMPVG
eukprot:scaffold11667_cov127-Isochrysis_galbana.AAC.7